MFLKEAFQKNSLGSKVAIIIQFFLLKPFGIQNAVYSTEKKEDKNLENHEKLSSSTRKRNTMFKGFSEIQAFIFTVMESQDNSVSVPRQECESL